MKNENIELIKYVEDFLFNRSDYINNVYIGDDVFLFNFINLTPEEGIQKLKDDLNLDVYYNEEKEKHFIKNLDILLNLTIRILNNKQNMMHESNIPTIKEILFTNKKYNKQHERKINLELNEYVNIDTDYINEVINIIKKAKIKNTKLKLHVAKNKPLKIEVINKKTEEVYMTSYIAPIFDP